MAVTDQPFTCPHSPTELDEWEWAQRALSHKKLLKLYREMLENTDHDQA